MAYPWLSYLIEDHNLLASSGAPSVVDWKLTDVYPLHSILKLTVKQNELTVSWNSIYRHMLTTNRMTGVNSYQWRSLCVTIMHLRLPEPLPSLPTPAMILIWTFTTNKLSRLTTKSRDLSLSLRQNFMHTFELKWVMRRQGNRKMLTDADSQLAASKAVIEFGWMLKILVHVDVHESWTTNVKDHMG